MTARSYLCLDGNEISNPNRVLTYVRSAGVAGFEVRTVPAPVSEAGGLVPENLVDFCDAAESPARVANAVTYVSPVADPAPWYMASRPASGEFLGFYAAKVELLSVLARPSSARSDMGAVLGPLHFGQRICTVDGVLLATSERGMRYGERWLTDVLAVCEPADASVLIDCDVDSFRTLREAGIVAGPTFGGNTLDLIRPAGFTLAAGLPYLYADAEDLVAEVALSTVTPHCAVVDTADWLGDTGLRITISSGSTRLDNVAATLTPIRADQDCDDVLGPAWATFTVPDLPPGRRLVIDGSDHTVTMYERSSGQVVGGFEQLDFDGLFRWFELGSCRRACVCVDATGATAAAGALVQIESIGREL